MVWAWRGGQVTLESYEGSVIPCTLYYNGQAYKEGGGVMMYMYVLAHNVSTGNVQL